MVLVSFLSLSLSSQGEEKYTFIEEIKNPQSVTILIKGMVVCCLATNGNKVQGWREYVVAMVIAIVDEARGVV